MSIFRIITIIILVILLSISNLLSCSKENPAVGMIGDVYGFGEYHSVNKKGNLCKNPMDTISWETIGTYEDKIVMLSEDILDTLPVLPQGNDDVINYILTWLNTDFYNMVFEDCVRCPLDLNDVDHPLIPDGNGLSMYKVTLMSEELLSSLDIDLTAAPTEYAVSKGCNVSQNGFGEWLILSDTSYNSDLKYVDSEGNVRYISNLDYDKFNNIGIRPVIILDYYGNFGPCEK